MRGKLQDVQAVAASAEAFAALTRQGRVVTWGHPESGGCSGPVQVGMGGGGDGDGSWVEDGLGWGEDGLG